MSDIPTGTITFLFTDIEGSTKLWERAPAAMAPAVAHHDTLIRQDIEAHNGYIFKTLGDAFCAAFATPGAALEAAIAAQQGIEQADWSSLRGGSGSGPQKIRVRIALHTGAVEQRGGDYFGPPLNRVARLVAAGHGGQILLSQATQELVRDDLPPGVSLRDMGERRLRDLIRPEGIFQVLVPDLQSEFPPLRTLDSRPNNLPVQPTPFIGRERQTAAACALLRRPDVHLVTFTGPGGTGKTRLSLQVATDVIDDFEHGVYFVPLAAITEPDQVPAAIARALGLKDESGQPRPDRLTDYLNNKQLLLVLDNFEQVMGAATLVADLIESAPQIKALVSSRTLLRLYGEHDFPVPPLTLPDPRHLPSADQLSQFEAVQLFIERALAVKPDFTITNDNAAAVAGICARLDGLPLAIELAAARVRLLSPQMLFTRLENRLKLLTGNSPGRPARQQTLRGTIDWSYDLLEADERMLFRRLAVFEGGCTLEAAEAVCNPQGDLPIEVLDGLEALVDKSLLRQIGAGENLRFGMLSTIQEYALERLGESGEAPAIQEAYGTFYLALGEEVDQALRGPDHAQWMTRLDDDHANFRAAILWALERALAQD